MGLPPRFQLQETNHDRSGGRQNTAPSQIPGVAIQTQSPGPFSDAADAGRLLRLYRADCLRQILSGPADRKSTRLNSSHSQISYAVFCLKKKKKTSKTDLSIRHV